MNYPNSNTPHVVSAILTHSELQTQIERLRNGQAKARNIAIVLTVGLVLGIAASFWRWPMLCPSNSGEFGGMIGGLASSFALIWLVAGYFLQSAELRINSLTLGYQACQQEEQAIQQSELVAQQRSMVQTSQSQVDALRALGDAWKTTSALEVRDKCLTNIFDCSAAIIRAVSHRIRFPNSGDGGELVINAWNAWTRFRSSYVVFLRHSKKKPSINYTNVGDNLLNRLTNAYDAGQSVSRSDIEKINSEFGELRVSIERLADDI